MATTTLTRSKQREQDRRVALKQAKRNAWAYVFISPFYLLSGFRASATPVQI